MTRRVGHAMAAPTEAGGPKPKSRVRGLGFRVQGLGFRVKGLGFRVKGLGCRV